MFDDREYEKTIQSIASVLSPQGWLLMFDFCHSYPQELKITEKSASHPDGLNLYFRPYASVKTIFAKHGFPEIEVQPFEIPVDLLPKQANHDLEDSVEALNTYTVKTESGKRLLFRGTLFQPWCHITAQKAS